MAGVRPLAMWILALLLSIPTSILAVDRVPAGDGGNPALASTSSPVVPPALFVENRGQIADPEVRFSLDAGGVRFGFVERAVLAEITDPSGGGVLVRATFEGANPGALRGLKPAAQRNNYLLGDDSTRWQTDVGTFGELVYENLYPGIDLRYRATNGGTKYEFEVAAGSDPHEIRIAYAGVETVATNARGDLVVHTVAGDLTDTAPRAFQHGSAVECGFALRDERIVGLDCRGQDPTRPFTIDPLVFATYLGGSADDMARAYNAWGRTVAVDGSGNVYVTGRTQSVDFPTTPGAYNRTHGWGFDAFVTKLDPTGTTLLYSTFIGGRGEDAGNALAVDTAGFAFVGGRTNSSDFPTTGGAFNRTLAGGADTFVLRLSAAGDALVYSTYLGGAGEDFIAGLVLGPSGEVFLTGSTASFNFPTTPGSFNRTYGSPPFFPDGFVAALDAAGGSLLFGTYLGGNGLDSANAIARDAVGDLYVTGVTTSTNFLTTPGALSTIMNGSGDAFVAKLDAMGSTLQYSTFVGGTGGPLSADVGWAIAVDITGNAYVGGWTNTPDFPTTPGAYNRTWSGLDDGFVLKLNPTGSALVYSTYLGATFQDEITGIAVDGLGRAVVAGFTHSPGFPTTASADNTTYLGGLFDGFVTKLDASGSALVYSTYLGGGGLDQIFGLALDAMGYAYVVGETNSTDFPATSGAYNTTNAGGEDAFVAKIGLGFPLTLASSPPGLQLRIDGNPVTAPFTYLCNPGSTHTVDAPSPQVSSSTRYVFNSWSDAGARNHTVTCAAPATLTATFVVTDFQITVDTSPTGLLVSVDGPQYTAPYAFWCGVASSHTIDTPSPQGSGPTRSTYVSWSDGGAQSHGITCNAPRTYTVTFQVEHQVTVTAVPLACQVTVDGVPWLPPATFWWIEGSTHSIGVPSPQVSGGTQYVFLSWSDGGAQTHSVTTTAPQTYTAFCGTQYEITVDTSPVPLQVLVNGAPQNAPYAFWCDAGGGATLNVTDPQGSGPTRYAFLSWSDGGAKQHAIVCASTATYVATFTPEYRTTIDTSPNALVVAVDGTNRTAPFVFYCASGSNHSVDAPSPQGTGNTRYAFLSWSDGGARTHTIPCVQPATYVATFAAEFLVTVDTSPANLTVTVDGATATAPQTYWWRQGSSHSVDTPSPQGSGATRFVWTSWSDGGPQAHAVTATGPTTFTAAFRTEHQLLLATSPPGLTVRLNGTLRVTPWTQWVAAGSTWTVAADSPQAGTAWTRFAWTSWSDGGAQAHGFTVSGPTSLLATFAPHYHLTLISDRGGSPWCDLPDCWYAANATATFGINVTESGGPGTQYVFRLWSGDLTRTQTVVAILMDGPKTETAQWTTQYFLTVIATPGTATGERWYNASETATFRVNATEVAASNGTRYRFVGWSLDFAGTTPDGSVFMDGPKTVRADWRPVPFLESNAWYLALLAAVVILLLLLFLWRRRKREQGTEEPAPAEEEKPAGPDHADAETPSSEVDEELDSDLDL